MNAMNAKKGNLITHENINFTHPELPPVFKFKIYYPECSPWANYYVIADFDTERQLSEYAQRLGFNFTWERVDEDGYMSGRTDKVIMPSTSVCSFYHPDEIADPKTPILSLSNGGIVQNYFTKSGDTIQLHTMNPNSTLYKPLSVDEHIKYQREHGCY